MIITFVYYKHRIKKFILIINYGFSDWEWGIFLLINIPFYFLYLKLPFIYIYMYV